MFIDVRGVYSTLESSTPPWKWISFLTMTRFENTTSKNGISNHQLQEVLHFPSGFDPKTIIN